MIHGTAPEPDLTPESWEQAVTRVRLFLVRIWPERSYEQNRAQAEALVNEWRENVPRRPAVAGSGRFLTPR